MEPAIIVTIISAAASIIVAALSFYFTKQKEREADWRKQKIEHYKDLLDAISSIVGTDVSPEGRIRFARACNTIVLVASQDALNALRAFQDEISISNNNKSDERHDKLLSELMLFIRKDIGISPADEPETFDFRLWCSGVSNDQQNTSQPSVLTHEMRRTREV